MWLYVTIGLWVVTLLIWGICMTAQRYRYLYGASRVEVSQLRWMMRSYDLEQAVTLSLQRAGMKYWLLPIGVFSASIVHLVLQYWFWAVPFKELAMVGAVLPLAALSLLTVRACRSAMEVRHSGPSDIRTRLDRTVPNGSHEKIHR